VVDVVVVLGTVVVAGGVIAVVVAGADVVGGADVVTGADGMEGVDVVGVPWRVKEVVPPHAVRRRLRIRTGTNRFKDTPLIVGEP